MKALIFAILLFSSLLSAGQSASEPPDPINNLMMTVTPNEDLAPGEYLLTWDTRGAKGYDFGVK